MHYEVGDYVYPNDLPRPVPCRVVEVDRMVVQGGEMIQILTLAPLEGPWQAGTELVRLDGAVQLMEDDPHGRVVSISQARRRAGSKARTRRRTRSSDPPVRLRMSSLRLLPPGEVGDA